MNHMEKLLSNIAATDQQIEKYLNSTVIKGKTSDILYNYRQ